MKMEQVPLWGGGRAPLLELPTVDLTFVVFDYLKVQAWQAVIESF